MSTANPAAGLPAATGRSVAAVTSLQDALVACESPRQRLLCIADTATTAESA